MRSRTRGTMLWMALVLLAIISVVIAATANVVQSDARRTRDEAGGAQLRQLLLAGQSSAIAELSATNALRDRPLPLPAELRDASVTIKVDSSAADRVVATVHATLVGNSSEQSLVYVRQNGGWRVESATLP